MAKKALVAGGSGYFGSELVRVLLNEGWDVCIFDLNPPNKSFGASFIKGDIRNLSDCLVACEKIDVLFHNIAQVPLSKNKKLFKEVNITGTENLVKAAKMQGVKRFIYTSSSAVFGVPKELPITNKTKPEPVEAYGRAKLVGERIVWNAIGDDFSVCIVRPRTILGQSRLGIFSILFRWVEEGLPIFKLGNQKIRYQFVHATDLAHGISRAAILSENLVLNLGALRFSTLKEELSTLCLSAATGSRVIELPDLPVRTALKLLSFIRLLPFAAYQLKLYSRSMYFDCEADWLKLEYNPKYSNTDSLLDSYQRYASADFMESNHFSQHQKPLKSFALEGATWILRIYRKIAKR